MYVADQEQLRHLRAQWPDFALGVCTVSPIPPHWQFSELEALKAVTSMMNKDNVLTPAFAKRLILIRRDNVAAPALSHDLEHITELYDDSTVVDTMVQKADRPLKTAGLSSSLSE